MKTKTMLLLLTVIVSLTACETNEINSNRQAETVDYLSESFLPMEMGNYWKINEENYTKIVDTIRIQGDLFYKFYSLTGSDVIGTQYLRIDDENNLIEKSPVDPAWDYTQAKFNSPSGDKFYTLNDKTVNDYEVTVIAHSTDTIEFSFNMVYHPNLKDHPHVVSYKRGLGLIENWKEVKIGDKIYRY